MSARTIEAAKANARDPSAATQAVLEAAIERDVRHNDRHHLLAFAPLLVLDAVLTYVFWNYGKREHPA